MDVLVTGQAANTFGTSQRLQPLRLICCANLLFGFWCASFIFILFSTDRIFTFHQFRSPLWISPGWAGVHSIGHTYRTPLVESWKPTRTCPIAQKCVIVPWLTLAKSRFRSCESFLKIRDKSKENLAKKEMMVEFQEIISSQTFAC